MSADTDYETWRGECLTIFVFGASGDLAKKKTYPALFALFRSGYMPKSFVICGYARSQKTDKAFKEHLRPYLKSKGTTEEIETFLNSCIYRNGQYEDTQIFAEVSKEVKSLHVENYSDVENRVFYLALPPNKFVSTSRMIKESGLTVTSGWNRVVVEKPLGYDTESAISINTDLTSIFPEKMLYRIDHYLGKEMVQNLITMRFSNAFLEPIWNRNYISSVQITFKENIGTQGRGGYFDPSGIIRDVMQNHLLQVLSIVAMEPPVRVAGADYGNYVRDEKVKVLKCIDPIKREDVVLGQYIGYLDDPTVPDDSRTPTFCTAIMYINNARWQGVPFIMKAGKALDERKAEVRVQLRNQAGSAAMFERKDIPPNEFVFRIQPSEAIYMKMNVKKPGLNTIPIQSEMDLSYNIRYPSAELHDAYVRLMLDVLRGKQATFVRGDELISAWKIVTPLLKEMQNDKSITPVPYHFGSRGPKESDELVKNAGYVINTSYKREWRDSYQERNSPKGSRI